MGRRLLAAAILGVPMLLVAASPARAESPTALIVADVTVAEPNHPDESVDVAVPVSLDRPATEPVEVVYHAGSDPPGESTIDYQDGVFTFAPGEVIKNVVVTVHRRTDTWDDTGFYVRAAEKSGTTGWDDVGHGTVVNSDRAGTWECYTEATLTGAHSDAGLPDGPVYGPLVDVWLGRGQNNCRYPYVGFYEVTNTTPEPMVVGDYTIEVGAVRGEVSRAEHEIEDTRPFVGDGVDARSWVSTVRITGPGVDIVIDGAWATASARCIALDQAPVVHADAGVTTLTVNGESHAPPNEPASHDLTPSATLHLNQTHDAGDRAIGYAVVLDVTLPLGSYARVVLGSAAAGSTGNPCTT